MINKTKLDFRLWNQKEKCFVRGYKEANLKQMFEGNIVGCASDSDNARNLSMAWWNDLDDYLIICRYTGLKDKEGTKIYEGDIIRVKDDLEYTFIVEWDKIGFNGLLLFSGDNKIIGNIYENPELMKKNVI